MKRTMGKNLVQFLITFPNKFINVFHQEGKMTEIYFCVVDNTLARFGWPLLHLMKTINLHFEEPLQ